MHDDENCVDTIGPLIIWNVTHQTQLSWIYCYDYKQWPVAYKTRLSKPTCRQ